jgi:hypothetical protein
LCNPFIAAAIQHQVLCDTSVFEQQVHDLHVAELVRRWVLRSGAVGKGGVLEDLGEALCRVYAIGPATQLEHKLEEQRQV